MTGDPTIAIAGKRWRVPLLAPRQNRVVLPALVNLGARPEEQYGALLDIAFAALTRAHSWLDRAQFEGWPIPTYELIGALPVIATQTGLMKARRGRRTGAELPDWDAIIAQFCNFLPGTTPDYWEDALTVPRLEAMMEEWRKHPPLALLYAGYHGYKPRPRDAEALEELLRLFPHGKLRLN